MSAGDDSAPRQEGDRGADDRFEELARSSGAEFRRAATSADVSAIGELAGVRRRRQLVAVSSAAALAVVGGLWLLPGGSSGTPRSPAPTDAPSTTLAASTTVPPTTIPLSVPVEGEIAYQRFISGHVEIRRLLPDGTDGGVLLEQLPVDGDRSHLDWAPSGDRVVVTVTGDDETLDLWIAAPDGAGATSVVDCVAPCIGVDEAAWSPDGSTIAFWRIVGPESSITSTLELLDVATGDTTVVLTAEPNTVILAPRWSPDGRRLAVELLVRDGPQFDADTLGDVIGVVDLDDTTPSIARLTAPERFGANPDWSPDGSSIVFAARVPGASTMQDLYLIAPDGTGERRLTTTVDDGDMAVQPTFTPDGSAVVFSLHPGGSNQGQVRVVPLAGGPPVSPGGDTRVSGDVPRMRPVP